MMALRKRSRDASDVDGEVEIESASSSFRQTNGPKRSRVALARENGGSVVSDDDDDEQIDGHAPEDSSDMEEPLDEDELDLLATHIVQRQLREHAENIESEEGVIEEVFCRNFMCHSKLRIKLGPLINFIIGHNGSGKSAVLTALTMCLGGKATATNRGASLKSLIKEGEESATLAVRIKNQGDGAYKPDLYGQSITVERNFTRGGTSGFKLKSAQDRVISTKKADLDDILDYFAFQLDNPINVLTQDMARQFLSNSSPSDKYKFFIRGTQLESLDADYKLMEEHYDSIEARLHSRQQDIDVLQQKVEEAERKKERMRQAMKIQEKVKQWNNMHAWAQVEEVERKLDEYNGRVREAEENVQEKTDAAAQYEGAYEGQNQAYEAAKRAVETHQEALRPAKENHALEKERFDANKQELLNLQTEAREIKENVRRGRADVKKYEDEVAQEQDRLAGAEGGEHLERLERLEELKAAAEAKNREQMDHGTGLAEIERRRQNALQQVEHGKQPVQQRKEALNRAEGTLRNLQQNQGNRFAPYRDNMEQLVKAIDRETRWRSKPVGPMGLHVRLLKQQWSSQIEKTFGGALESFIVTCKEDQTLLSSIMQRVRCQSGVFIGNPEPIDTSRNEPLEGVDTILRVLQIDDNLVRNSLIINQAIDQTVLIADRKEAEDFMYNDGRRQNVKVTMAILPADRAQGLRYEYTQRGAPKSSNVPAWHSRPRMTSDIQEQIAAARDNVNQASRDWEAEKDGLRRLELALRAVQEEKKRFEKRNSDLRVEFQKAEDAVEAQQAEIDSHRPEDGKLEELQRQLAEAKAGLESQEASFIDSDNAKHRFGEIGKEIKGRLDAATAELDQGNARVLKAEKRLKELEQARTDALREKNQALNSIDEARRIVTQLEEKRDGHQKTVDEWTTMAQSICRRVPVDPNMTAEAIDKRIERLTKDYHQAQREVGAGDEEEVRNALIKAKDEYNNAILQLKGMRDFTKALGKTLANRQKRWEISRGHISARARATFSYLLSERQFRGLVLMNHEDKMLDIKVEPDLSKASDAGRATKTLSGGEKSFSTICLLLSIWEAMGSPIRCLDEFDVFMDSVNRATSMSMMIKAARRSVGRQFILITPQSMANVDMDTDVRVHRMSDPERGQGVLPFS